MKHIEKQHPHAITYNTEHMNNHSMNEFTGPSAERDVDDSNVNEEDLTNSTGILPNVSLNQMLDVTTAFEPTI